MFTGIVEELGVITGFDRPGEGGRLQIQCAKVLEDAREGSSIAVDGVCLTALGLTPTTFFADLAPETIRRSNLGKLRPGSRVNLERPMALTDRLSGHIVQGHVDGAGELISLEQIGGDNWWLRIRVPAELDRYIVYKGSIAIDGVSLTVAEVSGDVVSITIIPHTYRSTSLSARRPGDGVNIECDMLAKHVEKLLGRLDLKPALTLEKLKEMGY